MAHDPPCSIYIFMYTGIG